MERKFRVFVVAGCMHTEVETGKGAGANIDFFIRRFTSWMPGALSYVPNSLAPFADADRHRLIAGRR
jgi:hypothetical protein